MMKIFNIMLAKDFCPEQKTFCNYSDALQNHCEVELLNIIPTKSQAEQILIQQGSDFFRLSNLNKYDLFTIRQIKKIINKLSPDIVIVHGSKAAKLTKKALQNYDLPVIGVCHGDDLKYHLNSAALFINNEYLRKSALELGQQPRTIYHISDFRNSFAKSIYQNDNKKPAVFSIGAIVNSYDEKSLILFCEGLAKLSSIKNFKAVISTNNYLKDKISNCLSRYILSDLVKLEIHLGDHRIFFSNIDIFCIISDDKISRLLLLDAFLAFKTVLSSDYKASNEIIADGEDGFIIKNNDSELFFEKLLLLNSNLEIRKKLANNAYKKLSSDYSNDSAAEFIISALNNIWLNYFENKRANINKKNDYLS